MHTLPLPLRLAALLLLLCPPAAAGERSLCYALAMGDATLELVDQQLAAGADLATPCSGSVPHGSHSLRRDYRSPTGSRKITALHALIPPLMLLTLGGPSDSLPVKQAPLGWAVFLYGDAFVDQLVDAGADLDQLDDWGNPPLYYALAREGLAKDPAGVERLLARGASPDALPRLSAEGLRRALTHDQLATSLCARKLDFEGDEVIEQAVVLDEPDILAVVLDCGAFDPGALSEPLQRALRLGRTELVVMLLDAGADLDATLVDALDRTWASAPPGDFSVVEALVAIGARLDGSDLATPLELMAERGRIRSVRYLLDQGVRPDRAGTEPVLAALQDPRPTDDDVAVLEALLVAGAPITPAVEDHIRYKLSCVGGRGGQTRLLFAHGLSVTPQRLHQVITLCDEDLFLEIAQRGERRVWRQALRGWRWADNAPVLRELLRQARRDEQHGLLVPPGDGEAD